ncbi:MAG: DinB family protein [Anaerolineae bacterium]|nr:DinB family protein [Anaerolineae bacterium]
MIKAVLLDLDDTLIGNPTGQFTRHYLEALDGFLARSLGVGGLSQPIMQSVETVIHSQDPLFTNRDTFFETLEPLLPVSRERFDAVIGEYYAIEFPRLQAGTTFRPAARTLVDWLLAEGYKVVVATAPFFPRVAIEQRLAWAGLPVADVPFCLVTTMEIMHYTKPHAAYYEEILARIGVHADEAVMVGDDWAMDIVPAWCAGLNTFWITNNGTQSFPEQTPAQPDGVGSLDVFVRLVQDEGWLQTLEPQPLVPHQIIPRLTGNLAGVVGVAHEVPPHVWHKHPDEAEWSPIEVICHMHESERSVQRPRLETIAREDNPFLSQPGPPPGPSTRQCPPDGVRVAFMFADERQRTLDFLARLYGDAWHRPARHYIFGPTTLLEMANFTAQHDRLHLAQLCQTAGKCG